MTRTMGFLIAAGGAVVMMTAATSARPPATPGDRIGNPHGLPLPSLAAQAPDVGLGNPRWSGYVAPAALSGLWNKQVAGSWTVPKVSWVQAPSSPFMWRYHIAWIGIGGWYEATLIQIGTESIVDQDGTQLNYLWYQMSPQKSVAISKPVGPEDKISASIACASGCFPGTKQAWKLTIANDTKGWSWTKTLHYVSSMASAEWIVEAPTYERNKREEKLPLNDFGQITFTGLEDNGAPPKFTPSNRVILETAYGQASTPSVSNQNNMFNICYGSVANPADCPSP